MGAPALALCRGAAMARSTADLFFNAPLLDLNRNHVRIPPMDASVSARESDRSRYLSPGSINFTHGERHMPAPFNTVAANTKSHADGQTSGRRSALPLWAFLGGLALVPLYLLSQPAPATVADSPPGVAAVAAYRASADASLPDAGEALRGQSDPEPEMAPTF
jgi:hypothetical protein